MTMHAAVGQIVRAPKTAELIAKHVRGQIVRGELTAGDTLPPETDLMGQFGVSRPTLREAFRILETESLIHVRRGSRGGAQVTAPEMSVAAGYVGLLLQMQGATVADVYEARVVLEPTCARMFAQRRKADAVQALQGAIDDVRQALTADSPDALRLAVLTYRVHEMIMRGSGNRTLAVQAGVLQDIVATHVASTVGRDAGTPMDRAPFRKLVRSYDKLLTLIETGDADGAERHWRKHMEVAGQALLRDVGPTAVVDLFN